MIIILVGILPQYRCYVILIVYTLIGYVDINEYNNTNYNISDTNKNNGNKKQNNQLIIVIVVIVIVVVIALMIIAIHFMYCKTKDRKKNGDTGTPDSHETQNLKNSL